MIHNDTRGPLHGPANAAVRPDRDHFFGRIWRVQHKQAKTLAGAGAEPPRPAGLMRAMETSPNAHVKANAWRLAHEHFPADPGSRSCSGRWEARRCALREGAAGDDRCRAARADRHVRAGDRQLDEVGHRRRAAKPRRRHTSPNRSPNRTQTSPISSRWLRQGAASGRAPLLAAARRGRTHPRSRPLWRAPSRRCPER